MGAGGQSVRRGRFRPDLRRLARRAQTAQCRASTTTSSDPSCRTPPRRVARGASGPTPPVWTRRRNLHPLTRPRAPAPGRLPPGHPPAHVGPSPGSRGTRPCCESPCALRHARHARSRRCRSLPRTSAATGVLRLASARTGRPSPAHGLSQHGLVRLPPIGPSSVQLSFHVSRETSALGATVRVVHFEARLSAGRTPGDRARLSALRTQRRVRSGRLDDPKVLADGLRFT